VLYAPDVKSQEVQPSEAAQHLREAVKHNDHRAILEAGDTGDPTLIPYLRRLASDAEARNNYNRPSYYAHVALAKLGDKDAINQILSDVDNESSAIQDRGINKLGLLGGEIALKKLYELLDDTKPRKNTDCEKMFKEHNLKYPENQLNPYCDVIYFPRSASAIAALRNLIHDPNVDVYRGALNEADLWKTYLKKNRLVAEP